MEYIYNSRLLYPLSNQDLFINILLLDSCDNSVYLRNISFLVIPEFEETVEIAVLSLNDLSAFSRISPSTSLFSVGAVQGLLDICRFNSSTSVSTYCLVR